MDKVKERDLFAPITRDERQEQCRKLWIKNKCRGSIEACTGFGKTRVGLNCISTIIKYYPSFHVLVIVPTDLLQGQWKKELDKRALSLNVEVLVVNSVIKTNLKCELLVMDECHRYNSEHFSSIFKMVNYKYVLGLTATFNRLDGREKIMQKYCPIIDKITITEALANNWVSQYTEYKVLINLDDSKIKEDDWKLETYKKYNKEFTEHYEFFGFDFNLAMSMIGKNGYKHRLLLRDQLAANSGDKKEILKNITYHSMGFMRALQKRKSFINNHPIKVMLANKIIESRINNKIITFSNNVKMAEKISYGDVYTGKVSKKRSPEIINNFNLATCGVLNTVKKANEGLDISGLSVAIILGLDSSKTSAIQRRGRAIRFSPGKHAEIFNLIINGTVENEWFNNSHEGSPYVTIDEDNLDRVLKGKEYFEYKKPIPKISFRF